MAIAVIGGLVTSTGLTLVMVPATFTWIDDLERWVSRKIGHRWINSPSVAAASASETTAAAPEPGPVVSAAGAASPAAQPTTGHPRDLPDGPLPDAAR
jgi:hypothetical protein